MDTKLSALASGAPALAADEVYIARVGGLSRKLTLQHVIALRAGRKNFIRNGDFQVAQLGTSFGVTGLGYTIDGWKSGGAGTSTVSRQLFPVGELVVPNNPRYMLRNDRTVAAGVDNIVFEQPMETPVRFSGLMMTASFWGRVTSGTKALKLNLLSSGVTSSFDVDLATINLTTAFQLFEASVQFSVMSAISGPAAFVSLRVIERAPYTTFTFDMADVQFERGDKASAFERLEEEEQLDWNQRFLEKSYSLSDPPGAGAIPGAVIAPAFLTSHAGGARFRVRKRAVPTMTIYSRNGTAAKVASPATGADVGTTVTAQNVGDGGFQSVNDSGSGFTVGTLYEYQWVARCEL